MPEKKTINVSKLKDFENCCSTLEKQVVRHKSRTKVHENAKVFKKLSYNLKEQISGYFSIATTQLSYFFNKFNFLSGELLMN
jgi:hypothetical protein